MRSVLLALLLSCACVAGAQEDVQKLLGSAAQYQALGFRQKAIQDLEQALGLVRADTPLAATVRGALGQAYLRAGDLAKAQPLLEQSLAGARELKLPAIACAALNDLGQLHLGQERRAEALAAFRESMGIARQSGAPLVFAAAATSAAPLLPPQERAPVLHEASNLVSAAPDSMEADFARIRLATAWKESSHPLALQAGYQLLDSALGSAAARNDRLVESYAAGYLGELYATQGRAAEGLGLTRRAVFAAQQARADESLYRWSWQSARLLEKAGEREPALAAYRRSLASLQAVRQDLMLELRAQRRSWREAAGPLFLEYADLLLRRAPGETVPQARLLEARNTVEQLKAVELEDYFQDDCVAGQLAKQKDIDAIAPRTAVLYPIVLPDRLEMLVGLAGGIRQMTLPIGAAALTEQALGFRRLLERRNTNQFMPFARRLYAAMFAPLEPLLAEAGVDTVVFIPDGPLRGLPVGALYDGKGFLVERFAFATAPGLTLVEPQAIAERDNLQILVNGITEAVQNFPALPYVGEEMESLKELLPKGRFLRDAQFRLPVFEEEVKGKPYSIVHIASHGEFGSDPKASFVLTYDGKLSMDNLEQVMKIARFRDDPIELLTLSACKTAAGDERAALGIAGVAVKAGARSALATLWYVSDEASSILVTDFYRRLPTTSKAKALQEAQRAVLADQRFRHPGYWAPFLLIGNWL
jgi:CHAT domain-containing protein